jgi:hypothetical protein
MPFFSYWFWPNPGGWYYTDHRVQALFAVCAALIVVFFIITFWRRSLKNPITKRLSRSWANTALWFGIVGIVLTASRVEMIQFLAMRAVWVVWVIALVLYVFFQFIQFRRKHYTVMDRVRVVDEREKYLPGKK